MSDTQLDNPFWWSLQTRHRALAQTGGQWARYPSDRAPFLGVASAGAPIEDALAPGEQVFLLGVAPQIPPGWQMQAFRSLAQMICRTEIAVIDGPEIVALGETERADVLALTALVYPHYFRQRTMDLGRYFGIYQQGQLAAMIGERLGTDTHREMSAICTHPDFLGRGYARRLTAFLTNDNLQQGSSAFLHVSFENLRALRLYQQMGYELRREIPFWSLQRPVVAA
jgi:ribosomal protein S18 acetylase RimI-like enzyme